MKLFRSYRTVRKLQKRLYHFDALSSGFGEGINILRAVTVAVFLSFALDQNQVAIKSATVTAQSITKFWAFLDEPLSCHIFRLGAQFLFKDPYNHNRQGNNEAKKK